MEETKGISVNPGHGGILGSIVRFSLRRRGVVIALAAISLGYGIYTFSRARYDVFPEFAPPQVVIHAEVPGFSPGQVEALITRPLENAVNGVGGIASLRSKSIQGLSVITVKFRTGIDIYLARQKVAERLSALSGQLPGGTTPIMTPLTSSTGSVLVAGLASDRLTAMELRTVADWTVRPRFLAVPGVSKIAVFGGEVRQLQVQVLPDRLIKYGLSMEDVLRAAKQATGMKGAGFIENGNQRIPLHTEGQSLTPAELADTVLVHENEANVMLGDVARVVDAPAPRIGGGAINGGPGILMVVSAQYGTNTLEVTRRLGKAIDELRPALQRQGVTIYPDLFRPADFIETALGNVKSSLLIGVALVVIVLFLFLFNLRTAAISCAAIPLSLLSAVTILERMGLSLNTMTMGGLAIAIGEVVDDAVIDVENIFRRLRENRHLENPRPALRVVLDASMEVRSAVVYATFAVVLVFVPILTMTGVAGRLFAPLGMAYVLAILASLAVALTVTPAMCALLLGGRRLPEGEPPVVRWLRARYVPLLRRVEGHPRAVIAGVGVLTLAGLAVLPFLGGGFVPELKEGHFVVHMTAVPGTSLAESLRMGTRLSKLLLALPEVRAVGQRVGRAEAADDIMGSHSSEIEVDLRPLGAAASRRVEAKIRDVLRGFPGANFGVNTFLTERLEETLSGYTAPVAVNIFGPDLDVLDAKAAAVAAVLAKVPGAADVLVQSPPGSPELVVRLRRAALARWGLDPVTALDAVRTAYQGEIVGQVYDNGRIFAAAVILDPALRSDPASVGELPLRNAEGTFVPLSRVAEVYETTGRYSVLHEGARRVQAVTCSVVGRDLASFVAEAKRRVAAAVPLPAGVYLDFAGSAAEQARSSRDLLVHAALAGIGILVLLSMVMGSGRNFLLVLANLPFALVGGIAVVVATGGDLSLGSLVGFVTVFGITLRNSIMLISHYEHLVDVEGASWGPETAVRGAEERLAPIVMTALVTGLGLLPLALGAGAPGREIEGPMAQVILGGLLTSTALNLLVLPALALRWARFAPRPAAG